MEEQGLIYGLIGKWLGHSFSMDFFNQKFIAEEIDAQYINFELEDIGDLMSILSEYSNLLATIGSCQLKLGNSQQAANTFEQAESNYRQFLQHDQTGYLYKSAIVGQINTVNIYLSEHQYDEAYLWTERFDSILTLYERQPYAERDYVDKQRARLNFYRATVLQAMGNQKEAAKVRVKRSSESQLPQIGDKIEVKEVFRVSEYSLTVPIAVFISFLLVGIMLVISGLRFRRKARRAELMEQTRFERKRG